jgi:CheY-like chemotaxis protein
MPKTLLIVDDSSIIRAAVVKAVEPTRLFARILQAPNGVGGLETLLNEDIDLMISDINMPNMDGYKLLLTLRSMEKYKDLPVILLSSKKETHDKIKGLQGGANDYVTKPFEPGAKICLP